ncbi:MAG: hypothetical protein JOZ51_27425, partial [Chloroflexi bacterium]|nr:hypothetical protein [Chloroflexota bacterium]
MVHRQAARTRFWLLGIVSLLLVATFSQNVPAQAAAPVDRDTRGAYQFPVKPGTAEWRALNSHDEMLKVTQVPAETLRGMSTADLSKTVLDYPLFMDMFAFNSIQTGFDRVASRFNGLTAFLARPDSGSVLLKEYQAIDPLAIKPGWSLAQQGAYDARITAIEMLLAQDAVRATLTPQQQQTLLDQTIAIYRAKQQRADVYGHTGLERTALVMGRVVSSQTPSFQQQINAQIDLQEFLKTGTYASPDVLSQIVAAADPKAAPVTDDVRTQDYYTTVYTPYSSAVTAIAMTTELTSSQISSANSYVASVYPQAVRETNASRKYNCHSYAWHNQSTSNSIWINTPGDDTYWTDGSYTRWQIPYRWFDNMKVSYVNDDHSAIDIPNGSSPLFRSKWGQYPRMRHAPSYSPYNSSYLDYFFPS